MSGERETEISEEGENTNSAAEVIESLDDAFDNPNLLDQFIVSIERDLSPQTSRSRTVIGQLKRIALRGIVSLIVASFACVGVAGLCVLLNYPFATISAFSASVFVAVASLTYGFMLTDWLPSAPD